MHITKIRAYNVKGRSFTIPLHPVSLIHGNNFSGKSAVAVALRLGLAGFLPPPIGKTASGIYSAVAGSPDDPGQMTVSLEFSESTRNSSLTYTKSGTRVSVSGAPACHDFPPILVDPKTFFGMSGPARMLAVFEACKVSVDPQSIRSMLHGVAPTAIPAHVRAETIKEVAAAISHKVTAAAGLPHVALKSGVEWLREQEKATKANIAVQEGVIAGLIWDDSEPEDLSSSAAEAAATLAARTAEFSALRKAAEAYVKTEQARAALQERVTAIRAEIPTYEWESEPPIPGISDIAAVESAQAELKAALAKNAKNDRLRTEYREQMERLRSGRCPTCGASCDGAYAYAMTQASEIPDPIKIVPLEEAVAKVNKALSDARMARSNYERDQRTLANLRHELENSEASLATMSAKPVDEASLEVARKEVERARAVSTLLNEGMAKWEAFQMMKRRRQEAQDELAVSRCRLEVLAAAVKAIRDRIESMVEESFGRILKVTEHFTDGILNSPLEFRDGEIGRRVSARDREAGCQAQIGSWISHEAFSGTEEAVAYAAFSVAMAMASPLKIVILDEMGRMDEDRREAVCFRMTALVNGGQIDQFIGIDTKPAGIPGMVNDIALTHE